MDVFVFVLAIATMGGIIKESLRQKRKTGGGSQQEYAARISTLEARVAILERILTDEKHHLRREIDALE